MKVVALGEDVRFTPLACLKNLVKDIESGEVTMRCMVLVAEQDEGDLAVYPIGPGMQHATNAVGLLSFAMTYLTTNALQAAGILE